MRTTETTRAVSVWTMLMIDDENTNPGRRGPLARAFDLIFPSILRIGLKSWNPSPGGSVMPGQFSHP